MKHFWIYNLLAVVFVIVLGGVLGTVWYVSRPVPADVVPVAAPIPAQEPAVTPGVVRPGDALLAEVLRTDSAGPFSDQPSTAAEPASLVAATDEVPAVEYTITADGTLAAVSPVPASPIVVSPTPRSSQSASSGGSGSSGSSPVTGSLASSATGGSSSSTSGTAAAPAAEASAPAPTAPTSPAPAPADAGGGGAPIMPVSDDLTQPRNIADIFWLTKEVTRNQRLLPITTAMNNLLKYDAFWTTAKFAELYPQAWRTLRTEYPDKLAMHYVTPFTVRAGGGASNLDIDYIERYHPEWFLLKDDNNATAQDYRNPDKRMRWNPDDPMDYNYDRFFLDVGNPSFQDWAVDQFVKRLDPVSGINARIRYSGIVADNVLLTVWVNSKTEIYPNWKYAGGESQWNQSYFTFLGKLHTAMQRDGYLLIVNHTTDYSSNRDGSEWQDLMNIVDGMADENALLSSSGLFGGEMWEWSLTHHEEILEKGLYDWWIFTPDTERGDTEFQQFLYVYGSFLLVRDDTYSLFGTIRRKDGVDLNPWYEEYNIPLGDPMGRRYPWQGCWMRDFQYGKVVVNPSNVRVVIPLGTETYTLDWRTKKQITQLTLDPLSATILLPTGYSSR
jgi:hypothetical protein